MQRVIDISEEDFRKVQDGRASVVMMRDAIRKGTPLPKGHSFIAICDSDFPITEEVKQELKNTAFVGNEDCHYCFDMTEIIEADKEEGSDKE